MGKTEGQGFWRNSGAKQRSRRGPRGGLIRVLATPMGIKVRERGRVSPHQKNSLGAVAGGHSETPAQFFDKQGGWGGRHNCPKPSRENPNGTLVDRPIPAFLGFVPRRWWRAGHRDSAGGKGGRRGCLAVPPTMGTIGAGGGGGGPYVPINPTKHARPFGQQGRYRGG